MCGCADHNAAQRNRFVGAVEAMSAFDPPPARTGAVHWTRAEVGLQNNAPPPRPRLVIGAAHR